MGWTKEQTDAINKSGTNIIVSAGAGSGKTAVLTERVIQKLLNGISIDRLLILTFTNAAALEMKNRIRGKIIKEGLTNELDKLDSAYITTFDSFALSIVKKYHINLGISKDIKIMDSSIEFLKTSEIIDNIFDKSYGKSNFNKLIYDFCSKDDGYIKNIFKNFSKKLDLLTNKNEYLNTYIDTHYNDNYIDSVINKYESLVLKIKDSIYEPYSNLSSLVDEKYLNTYNLDKLLESNSYNEVKDALLLIGTPRKNNNCDDDYKIYKEEINLIVKRLINLTRFKDKEEIKNIIYSTKDYVSAFIDLKKAFDKEFLKFKHDTNLYTFNDIAIMSINVVKNNKDIQEELKNSFDEIMVDEYQDTSDIEEELINLISNNNVYMVGDIKQSIYRFRNANPYIFRNKYSKYSNNDGGIKIDLNKNFRSRKEVLDNINLIFNLIMDNDIGDADYFLEHQMNFGNLSYDNELKTEQNNNMEILTYNSIKEYSKEEIEAFIIANDIKNKIDNKYKIVDKETYTLRECKYSDFSIIMDRGTSFDLYKKIFEYRGIPINQIKSVKLSNGYDMLILSNLIKLIIKINLGEYDNELKYLFTSISRSYLCKIDDEVIFDYINSNNIYDSELYKICKGININEISTLNLIDKIIEKFDLYNKILSINNISEVFIKLDYLKNLSVELGNIGYTIMDFSKYLDTMISEDIVEYSMNDDNSNSVKILNIHKSKGLEYSVCYFSGLYKEFNKEDIKSSFLINSNFDIITPYKDDGVCDTIFKDLLIEEEKIKDISEKIRLFYVALTRAKEKIILVKPFKEENVSYTSIVPYNIRIKYNKFSDFIDSIETSLKDYIINVNIDELNLTKDYDKNISYNYQKEIDIKNIDIDKRNNNIEYNSIIESKFSKNVNKLLTKEEYNNMIYGTEIHKIFEMEDFKNTNNNLVLRFLNKIDNNYINIFKEYEFMYECDNSIKHGIIDLMLEYDNYINIIDYKTKNINDINYIKQLNGYKNYIESISNKKVFIYLYSIIDDVLEEAKDS